MNKLLLILLLAILPLACSFENPSQPAATPHQLLPVEAYQEAVYASWIGQIVGNTYGLCYEFQFIEQPGPDSFPYGYTWTLDLLRRHKGAFSDDDTDIEYMYLTQMEKHGVTPTYNQLTAAWKNHVESQVWCANRQALTLMHAGHYPPVTGAVGYNSQWCQIDPQLVNEIWAVTAPGMVDYAVDKSRYAAHIMSDSFGMEPTLHYAAMYSAAFFEKDILKLIDIGTAALAENARFAGIVEHVKKLYAQYPKDWQSARKIVKDKYLVSAEYNKHAWPPIDANLNGAFGIMALLYGQGDFQRTLDYCCAFGMDADNQAATMCGLLGIVNGLEGIPKELMFPLAGAEWEKPFNDSYKVITRERLPNAKLSDMAARIAAQGEKVILDQGGELVERGGVKYYKIPTETHFSLPFELNPIPDFYTEINRPFSYPVYAGGREITVSGDLPPGIGFDGNRLSGTPTQPGKFAFQLVAQEGLEGRKIEVKIQVHPPNLAPLATGIIFNQNALDKNIEIIRDGKTDQTYHSTKKGRALEIDFYGYTWDTPQTISSLSLNNGVPSEFCGWFTTFDVSYLRNGQWWKVTDFQVYPEMNLDDSQWLKPHLMEYEISFAPVVTKGIRIKGWAGGVPKDEANAHLGMQFNTSVAELRVYGE